MSQVDVIVIGGGVAGLVAAAFLARDGREVVLVEQNSFVGGCVGGFTRQGYYFDGGAQSTTINSCPLSTQAWEVRKPVIAACNGHAVGGGPA